MFRIRREQMNKLAGDTSDDYRRRLTAWLVAEYPASFEGMQPEDIRAWVDDAVSRSEGHGIAMELETTQLVSLYLLLGLEADVELTWFRETLADRDLVPQGKVRRLLDHAREEGTPGIDRVERLSEERAA
jgi:hypothetical protein